MTTAFSARHDRCIYPEDVRILVHRSGIFPEDAAIMKIAIMKVVRA